MPYPSVNLETPPPAKPAPSPIVAYRAQRHAYTHDPVKCTKCGAVTEQFADAVHADGSVTGWVPVCETCAPKAKRESKVVKPEPTAPPSPAPVIPAADPKPAP